MTTDCAQLRVVPRVMLRACHLSVSLKTCAGGSVGPCEPEHSVNQIAFVGKALCRAVIRFWSPA